MRFELDFFCISFLKMHIKIYISKFIVSHNLFIYILQIKLEELVNFFSQTTPYYITCLVLIIMPPRGKCSRELFLGKFSDT